VRDSWMALLLSLLLFTVSTMTWLYHGFRALALNSLPVPPRWFALAALPLSLALSTVMFYCAYRYVPRRQVRVGPALAGAVLASVLWEIAKQLFRFYIQRVSLYNEIYGPLAVLVAFAMFVYYSAVVFVFSAAFVAALDSRRT
jgi:membrane protein